MKFEERAKPQLRRPPDGSETITEFIGVGESMYIPGLLHIIHNVAKDLVTSVDGWSDFVVKLSQVSKILAEPFYFQRLIESCYRNVPGMAVHAEALMSPSVPYAHVHEGRWASVSEAILTLREVEIIIFCWVVQRQVHV